MTGEFDFYTLCADGEIFESRTDEKVADSKISRYVFTRP